MDKEQLAALDRAATQGVWEAHLIDGTAYMVSRPNSASTFQAETIDDLRLAAALVNAYRTGKLVLIDEGSEHKVWCAIATALDELDPDARIEELTDEEEHSLSRAAIAALGVK